MAIGWLTAFKAIPWGEVIAAAPAVVLGARKLLDVVRNRGAEAAGEARAAPARAFSDAERVAVLEDEVKSLRRSLAELQAQQVAATSLVESLADQNQKLVSAVEILRIRTRVLLLVALIAVALVVWEFLKR